MKNENENEDFFYLAKIFQFLFFWNFELRWFQIWFQIFHILLRSKVTTLGSWSILPVFAHFKPTLEGCNFWSKQDMKNLKSNLKSARFKVSEKYKLKYFGQKFFHFHFSFSFSNFLKIFKPLNFSTWNYLFNELLLLSIHFFLEEQFTKCADC